MKIFQAFDSAWNVKLKIIKFFFFLTLKFLTLPFDPFRKCLLKRCKLNVQLQIHNACGVLLLHSLSTANRTVEFSGMQQTSTSLIYHLFSSINNSYFCDKMESFHILMKTAIKGAIEDASHIILNMRYVHICSCYINLV